MATAIAPSTGFEPSGTVANHPAFDALGYAWGQCTAFLAETVPWLAGGKGLGNADNWLANWKAQGGAVSSTPLVGSIAVFSSQTPGSGGAGHVALVQSISGDTFNVSEANVKGLDTVSSGTYNIDNPNIIGYIVPPATATTTAATSSSSGGGIDLNPLDWLKSIGIFILGLMLLGFALFYLFRPSLGKVGA